MRQDFFQFKPSHTLFLSANHRPTIRGTDNGIWRRVKLIPFTVTIPADRVDLGLKGKLQAESSGILNWALAGYQDWATNGLNDPPAVRAATSSYRAEMDVVGAFIAECCILAPKAETSSRELYARYVGWCNGQGENPLSQIGFGRNLGERGLTSLANFGKSRSSGWRGIEPIRPSEDGRGVG
jgi:putative DNA primase/helicase